MPFPLYVIDPHDRLRAVIKIAHAFDISYCRNLLNYFQYKFPSTPSAGRRLWNRVKDIERFADTPPELPLVIKFLQFYTLEADLLDSHPLADPPHSLQIKIRIITADGDTVFSHHFSLSYTNKIERFTVMERGLRIGENLLGVLYPPDAPTATSYWEPET